MRVHPVAAALPFRIIGLSLLSFALARPVSAQLITIRTVPIAEGDQFAIFPSHNLGMGGASIALADTLLDPFRNPATSSRLRQARAFGSPALYSVSSGAGSGRALPLGAFLRSGPWFGGLTLALQQVDASQEIVNGFPILDATPPTVVPVGLNPPPNPVDVTPGARSHGNEFAVLLLGREVPGSSLSLAASLSWAGLRAIDGVDLLYPGMRRLDQYGHSLDARIGLLKELPGNRSLQAVVLHNRFAMTHDVTYLDFFWDPATQQIAQRPRMERNLDHTNTWGLHLEYALPLASASGWRIGWIATANHMSHPKIPNYDIMSIPRDPGQSDAFNLGVGVSRRRGAATFALDAIYEPIWTHTWAEAEVPTPTPTDTIAAGGRTIENHFRFQNALIRFGISRDFALPGAGKGLGMQLGLVVRSVDYRLTQDDYVAAFQRHQSESWVEWTPTWGLSLRLPEFELRYRGSKTHGTGRPGVQVGCTVCAVADGGRFGGGVVAAPSGPMTLTDVHVMTHQVSLSFPLR